jgi:hypothetical protein
MFKLTFVKIKMVLINVFLFRMVLRNSRCVTKMIAKASLRCKPNISPSTLLLSLEKVLTVSTYVLKTGFLK